MKGHTSRPAAEPGARVGQIVIRESELRLERKGEAIAGARQRNPARRQERGQAAKAGRKVAKPMR